MIIAPAPLQTGKSPRFLEVPKRQRRRPRSSSRHKGEGEAQVQARLSERSPSALDVKVQELPCRTKPDLYTLPIPSRNWTLSPFQRAPDSPPPESSLLLQAGTNGGRGLECAMPATSGLIHAPDMIPGCRSLSPPPTPPKAAGIPLRERLIGTWRLESYVAYPTPTSRLQRAITPMSKHVTGLIMYTPDGYMSAHMLMPGQPRIGGAAAAAAAGGSGDGDEKVDDTAQWAEASKRCFAYAGPYFVSEEEGEEKLRHTFQVCSLPGWIGDVQVRTWRFEDDGEVLVLGSDEPVDIRGDLRFPELKWRRCLDNSRGRPPPPVPQIKISGPGEW